MSVQFGAFLAGLNLILRPLVGGKVIIENPISLLSVNTHRSALPGNLFIETIEPIVTANATATILRSISCAVNQVVIGEAYVLGKRSATADAIVSRVFFGVSNNAGTTAALAAANVTSLENSAGTPALTAPANDTTDTVDITVAGIAAENWTWSGYVHYQRLTVA